MTRVRALEGELPPWDRPVGCDRRCLETVSALAEAMIAPKYRSNVVSFCCVIPHCWKQARVLIFVCVLVLCLDLSLLVEAAPRQGSLSGRVLPP